MIYYKKRNGSRGSLFYWVYLIMAIYMLTQREWWIFLATMVVVLAENWFLVWTRVQEGKK